MCALPSSPFPSRGEIYLHWVYFSTYRFLSDKKLAKHKMPSIVNANNTKYKGRLCMHLAVTHFARYKRNNTTGNAISYLRRTRRRVRRMSERQSHYQQLQRYCCCCCCWCIRKWNQAKTPLTQDVFVTVRANKNRAKKRDTHLTKTAFPMPFRCSHISF